MAPYTKPELPKIPSTIDPLLIGLDIVGFILQLLGFGKVDLKPLESAINTSWTNLVFTSTFLYNALHDIFDFLRRLLSIVVDGIKHIISDVLHGHLLNVLHDIQKLIHDLHALFKPILDFLDAVMKWYRLHILPIQKLIIEVLQRIRVVLEIFRLLGAKWAAKLDADLQKIQAAVTTSIVDVVKTLNTISTLLGLALDPGMVLRKDFFGRTLWNSLGDLKKAVGFGSARPIYPDEKAQAEQYKSAVFGPAPLITQGADGTLVYDPALKLVNDQLDEQMRTLGLAH